MVSWPRSHFWVWQFGQLKWTQCSSGASRTCNCTFVHPESGVWRNQFYALSLYSGAVTLLYKIVQSMRFCIRRLEALSKENSSRYQCNHIFGERERKVLQSISIATYCNTSWKWMIVGRTLEEMLSKPNPAKLNQSQISGWWCGIIIYEHQIRPIQKERQHQKYSFNRKSSLRGS